MNAEKRILQERENWRKERPFGYVAKPLPGKDGSLNLFAWECSIPGPEDSPFQGHTLHLLVDFYQDYPASPPNVRFTSNVFHPNIYSDGFVCLDVLSSEWRPSMNIKSILLALYDLISSPNTESPANNEAATVYASNPSTYIRKAKQALEAGRKGNIPKKRRNGL
ncbi:ubiquitin-conjugating enzyme E2 I [Nematocida displodere]|uniref:Ubiquitin-conjugating enzyme E2 I n=1 Tax=Nematocida displodere TaxID=1805483 RepID=A0A177ECG3_9MICR|nr:ubiquitin-conjugating enzyme E2 I [Nematocida displodere]